MNGRNRRRFAFVAYEVVAWFCTLLGSVFGLDSPWLYVVRFVAIGWLGLEGVLYLVNYTGFDENPQ